VITHQPPTEDLAAPSRPSRFGRVLVVVLALAVAAGVIIRIAASGSSTEHAAPATTPTTSSPPTVHSTPYTPPPDGPVVITPFHLARPCPHVADGRSGCTTFPGVPASVDQLLRAHFPSITDEHGVTEMLRVRPHGLWSREITGRLPGARLHIEVSRAEPGDAATTGTRSGSHLLFVSYVRWHFLLQVRVLGVLNTNAVFSKVAELLADRRLVRTIGL
jgi:hypothetical protein